MGSVRRRGATVRVSLDEEESALLSDLASQVVALLGEDLPAQPVDPLERLVGLSSEPVRPPADPALQRLLPDAYPDDERLSAEFRRLTDSDLRTRKVEALRRLLTDLAAAPQGHRLELDPPSAEVWLLAINDIRLALGTRLEVTEDVDDERRGLAPGDPRYAELAVYDWLSWLQDAMVRAVARG